LFFEPQRYHHIMFANFYRFVTNEDYSRETVFLGKKNKLQKLREEKE
jgi:hypothetical protein